MTARSNGNGEHTVPPPPPPPPAAAAPSTPNGAHHQHHTVPPSPSPQPQSRQPQPQQPPPPGQHHHYYHYPPPSSSSSASFKGCCCCLFLFLAFLALLSLAVVLVIVLAVKPKKPQFDLQEVAVEYLGLSSPSSSSTAADGRGVVVPSSSTASLSLRIGMSFTAANENKVGIKYGESRFTVMYRGVPLGRASVPGFYQPSHSVRRVSTTVAVDRVNLLQTNAADLMKDALVNDRVELRVLGDVAAKIRIVGLTSPAVQVSVDCAIVISPKKQSVTYKQCGFDGLNV